MNQLVMVMVQYVSLTSNWREEKGYAKCECGCIAQERDCRGAKEFRMPVEKYATFCLSLHLCSDNVRIGRVIMEQYTVSGAAHSIRCIESQTSWQVAEPIMAWIEQLSSGKPGMRKQLHLDVITNFACRSKVAPIGGLCVEKSICVAKYAFIRHKSCFFIRFPCLAPWSASRLLAAKTLFNCQWICVWSSIKLLDCCLYFWNLFFDNQD